FLVYAHPHSSDLATLSLHDALPISTYNRIIGNMKDRFLRKISVTLRSCNCDIWGLNRCSFCLYNDGFLENTFFLKHFVTTYKQMDMFQSSLIKKFLPKFFEISTRSPRARDNIDHLASVLQIEQAH